MEMATDRSSRTTRGSALWGSGNRGGERRFGSRRGLVVALVGAFALSAPFAAFAGSGTPTQPSLVPVAAKVGGPKSGVQQGTYVPPALLKQAEANGNQRLHVIIQASGGTNAAASAFAAERRERRRHRLEAALGDQRRRGRPQGQVDHAAREGPGPRGHRRRAGRRPPRRREAVNSQLWPYVVGQREALGLAMRSRRRTRRRSRSSTPASTRATRTSAVAPIRR